MGLTVLSIGTSIPEISSHIIASLGILTNKLDYNIISSTVLGANIGSDIIQQTFILGLVILICGGLTFSKHFLKKDFSIMIGTALLTLILGLDGTISRLDGILLFTVFVWFIYSLYKDERKTMIEKEKINKKPRVEILSTAGWLILLIIASTIALKVIESFVKSTSLSGSMVGVFTLGIASALPEFFTAIEGLKQKARGISIGTLIGSNITNPLVAIGLGGMLSTYYVPKPLVQWDLPMATITAALLLMWIIKHKGKANKGVAVYLMLLYFAYIFVRIRYFGID